MDLKDSSAVEFNPNEPAIPSGLRTPDRRVLDKSFLLASPVVQRAEVSQSSLDYKPLIIPKIDFRLFQSPCQRNPGHLRKLRQHRKQTGLALQGERKRETRRLFARAAAKTGIDFAAEMVRFRNCIRSIQRFAMKKMYKMPPHLRKIEHALEDCLRLSRRSAVRWTGRLPSLAPLDPLANVASLASPDPLVPFVLRPLAIPSPATDAANQSKPQRFRFPLFPFESGRPKVNTASTDPSCFEMQAFSSMPSLRLIPFPVVMPKGRRTERTVGRTGDGPEASSQKAGTARADSEGNLFSQECRFSMLPSMQ